MHTRMDRYRATTVVTNLPQPLPCSAAVVPEPTPQTIEGKPWATCNRLLLPCHLLRPVCHQLLPNYRFLLTAEHIALATRDLRMRDLTSLHHFDGAMHSVALPASIFHQPKQAPQGQLSFGHRCQQQGTLITLGRLPDPRPVHLEEVREVSLDDLSPDGLQVLDSSGEQGLGSIVAKEPTRAGGKGARRTCGLWSTRPPSPLLPPTYGHHLGGGGLG